jgi:hypothetical protein
MKVFKMKLKLLISKKMKVKVYTIFLEYNN